MEKLTKEFSPLLTRYGLGVKDRQELFEIIIDQLIEKRALPVDFRAKTIEALEEREKKLSTAVGNRLALPHASVEGIPHVLTAAVKTAEEIDYQAPDHQGVDFFFLVLIPKDEYSTHLRAIASVSQFFRDEAVMQSIQAAGSEADLSQCFL
ncbi:MAG: PTS sugar transporter subunit IIA [Verrucomicrobiota bacterium]